MIPFTGLLQAVIGSVPGLGDKTANFGKTVHGLPDDEAAVLLSEDNAHSFLAWVRTFMDSSATVEGGGESGLNLQDSAGESGFPALDQFQALIAGAMGPSPAGSQTPQAPDEESSGDGQVQSPQELIEAIMASRVPTETSGNPAPGASSSVSATMVAQANGPADGPNPATIDDRQIMDGRSPVVQMQPGGFKLATHTGPTDDPQMMDGRPAVAPTQPAVPAVDRQMKENPFSSEIKEKMTEEGLEKEVARSLSKAGGHAGDEEKNNASRFVNERLPAGSGTSGKAVEYARPQPQGTDGQARGTPSIAMGAAGQQAASPEDDSANFLGRDKHSHTQRMAVADVDQDELQKAPSSDGSKSTVHEPIKSPPSFQDTVKAMEADPLKNTANLQQSGQTAGMDRTEASVARSFQTTVMDQIVGKAAMRSIHGRSEMQIHLKPEFLGNVQINIITDRDQLVVRIMTDRPAVKEIIEGHLHHLKTELQNQGLTIDKFDVMVNPDADQQHSREQFAQLFKHPSFQQGRRQPHGEDPEMPNRDEGHASDDDSPVRDGVNYFA